MKLNFKVTI